MSAPTFLTPVQRDDLRVVAGMIIPASKEYAVPGADDTAIQADILATLGRDTAMVREALDHLARLAGMPTELLSSKKREATMRYGLIILGVLVLAAPAHAETRSAYVTMVLQAFAAKVECPGTDIVYQDLVQKAQDMQLPDATTEKVRK